MEPISHNNSPAPSFLAARRVSNEFADRQSPGHASPHHSTCTRGIGQVELTSEVTANGNIRKLVAHNYHDYSLVAPTAPSSSSPDRKAAAVYVNRGGTPTLFPLKLYVLLDDAMSADPSRDRELPGVPDGKVLSQIVCFQPHGRAFKVQGIDLFKAYVLPVYFGKMKYSSFLRQLNLYGFTRLSKGVDKGGYYHELFLQNRQFLVHRIQRTKVKGSKTRAAANPKLEPNFYAMTYMCEIPCPRDKKEGGTILPDVNQSATEDTDINDKILYEPFSVAPIVRYAHRQVSVTSSDFHESSSTLDSFHLDAEGDNDMLATENVDLDLDMAILEDLLGHDESLPAISVQASPPVDPTPLAVPPFLMSQDAAARYKASFVPPVADAAPYATKSVATTMPPITNLDSTEITFLQSLFVPESSAMSIAKLASAKATNKNAMEANSNAQADYRNNVATNGERSRFKNTRAARTA
mmetsp:Transcript_27060/g.63277  ORF Transcript_27060/g.63277 Transcript_27060/m.63277 type:complete len:466 (-) Transcript_27060:69-1466(-)